MSNYTATTWVDDQPAGTGTPLNAANLNKLEGGASNALPMRSVFPAGQAPYANNMLAGDTVATFAIMGDGRFWWGPGGSMAQDTSLYRLAPNFLSTSGDFVTRQGNAGQISLQAQGGSGGAPIIYFGSAQDTNLYRAAAGELKTDGVFRVGRELVVNTSDTPAVKMYFGSALDTNLYRYGASMLATDDKLLVGGSRNIGVVGSAAQARNTAEFWHSSASLTTIGETVDGNANPAITMYRTSAGAAAGYPVRLFTSGYPRGLVFQIGEADVYGGAGETYTTALEIARDSKLLFGPEGAQDTNLYRSGANVLVTDDQFVAIAGVLSATHVIASNGAAAQIALHADGRLYFGSAYDTNLYRSAAGVLKTDGALLVGSSLWIDQTNASARLYWGSAGDTNLYRSAADTLKTDDNLIVGTDLYVRIGTAWQVFAGYTGGNAGLQFGSAGDTNLYRFASGELITHDGIFGVGNTSRSMLKIGGGLNGGTFGYTAGDRGIWFADSSRFAPSPPSGGYLYSAGGNLHWISAAGKDTTIATNV